jgi:hypothetical protein
MLRKLSKPHILLPLIAAGMVLCVLTKATSLVNGLGFAATAVWAIYLGISVTWGSKFNGWLGIICFAVWAVIMTGETLLMDGTPCEERAWMQNLNRLPPCPAMVINAITIAWIFFLFALLFGTIAIMFKYRQVPSRAVA